MLCRVRVDRLARVRSHPRDGSGGRNGLQSRFDWTSSERNHEGTTVGQADVRKVQDHPAPCRGSGHLQEPPSQAAAGEGSRWLESPEPTSPATSAPSPALPLSTGPAPRPPPTTPPTP